jgi:hypothetical protein
MRNITQIGFEDGERIFWHGHDALRFGGLFGSGDGERKTLLTQQIAYEPLPASVSASFLA